MRSPCGLLPKEARFESFADAYSRRRADGMPAGLAVLVHFSPRSPQAARSHRINMGEGLGAPAEPSTPPDPGGSCSIPSRRQRQPPKAVCRSRRSIADSSSTLSDTQLTALEVGSSRCPPASRTRSNDFENRSVWGSKHAFVAGLESRKAISKSF